MLGMIIMITLVSSVSATSKIKISYEEDDWIIDFFAGGIVVNEFELCNEYNEDKEIYLSYEIEGNSSNLDGIEFSFSDNNFDLDEDDCKDITFTITSQPNYKADSFTITIRANDEDIDDDSSNRGWFTSGGSCTYDTNYDWNCTDWSECLDGEQTRTCKDKNNCYNEYGKPDETKTCDELIILGDTDEDTDTIDDTDTTDDEEKPKWIWIVAIIIVVIVLILIYLMWKAKEDKTEESSEEDKDDKDDKDDELPPNAFPLSTSEELLGDVDGH